MDIRHAHILDTPILGPKVGAVPCAPGLFYCAQCVAKSTPKNAHESVLFDTIRLRASPWILTAS